jgi:hypothetical protein
MTMVAPQLGPSKWNNIPVRQNRQTLTHLRLRRYLLSDLRLLRPRLDALNDFIYSAKPT